MKNEIQTPWENSDPLGAIVQDIEAILQLLGTEQCSVQVSSALTRGYLYAAATPMSIFGSLIREYRKSKDTWEYGIRAARRESSVDYGRAR